MHYNKSVVTAYFKSEGLPSPEYEYRFHAIRRWRFDLAWPKKLVALEVDGGTWSGGRHSRGAGQAADREKANTAALMGWVVLRCIPQELCMMETVEMLKQALS